MNNFIPDRNKTKLMNGDISLRPYKKQDAEELYKAILVSQKDLWPWLPFAHENYSLYETKDWIKKSPTEWKKGISFNFAICDMKTGEMIGGCGINQVSKMDRWANLGYWVRSDRAGRGIAVAATKLLAKWGFEVLKLKRIEIHVAADNARSLRVAEKSGAKREGILRNRMTLDGRTRDSVMHSLIPGEV
jgi:RimJ/RimL family protein N-acetyltransferase